MKLIIASNRLPISLSEAEDGSITAKESVGGLVTGIGAYLASLDKSSIFGGDFTWAGWPGMSLEGKNFTFPEKVADTFKLCPVDIPDNLMDSFYYGFCNKTIWPLFHYFTSYVEYNEEYWNSYVKVNQIFFDALKEIIEPGDYIWVHDYHLMLLPQLIREAYPDAVIGFFLHIPFPSYEIFRLLSNTWRSKILKGLMGSDVIGFHTYDYTQHFLNSLSSILGLEHHLGTIHVNDRIAKVDTFPMGIDYNKYHDAAALPQTQNEVLELKESVENRKIILSIDRLDYSKGILNRLQAFEEFLQDYPQWREQVVLMLVVVPSRTGVDQYQQMKKGIDELVGNINGKFGTLIWTPILYQYKFFSLDKLSVLYAASDVCLVTPLRDGMNLIAKEYIASRIDKKGMLIISETAGATNELGEVLVINPNNTKEISDAINSALEMDEKDQIRINTSLQQRIKEFNVQHWATDFVESLSAIKKEQNKLRLKVINPEAGGQIVNAFRNAGERLLIIDYDGTIVPFSTLPTSTEPPADVTEIIQTLASIENTKVVIISGSDRFTMEKWFPGIPLTLVAEHGVWIKEDDDDWIMPNPLLNDWKPTIRPILERYAARLPRTFIQEKEYSMAWHYRSATAKLAQQRARELVDTLKHLTANVDIQVLQGHKVIEVRSAGVNKGLAALHLLSGKSYDFILAIGDDDTDEDIFKVLPETANTIRVGLVTTLAKNSVLNQRGTLVLLKNICMQFENDAS